MKIRQGFISNSSSSSFLVISKEDSLYKAFEKEYDDIFHIWGGHPDFANKFIYEMKDFWLNDVMRYEENVFSCNDNYDRTRLTGKELKEAEKIYSMSFGGKLPKIIKEKIEKGWNVFHLNIPDAGEGGNYFQIITKKIFAGGFKRADIEVIDCEEL